MRGREGVLLITNLNVSARIKSSGARLSQIEEGCPLRDVTCADDTDKVVKVLFSVETAEVGNCTFSFILHFTGAIKTVKHQSTKVFSC